jgi:hypothetical protein
MTNMNERPSSSQQDPAEGSREVVERELRRKTPGEGSSRAGEGGKAPDGEEPNDGSRRTQDAVS